VLNLFNNEWTNEQKQGQSQHHMLQMELMHRRRDYLQRNQQQQHQQPVGNSIMLGGCIVEPDPSAERAALLSTEATEAAAQRVLIARTHGQDILCIGQSAKSGFKSEAISHHPASSSRCLFSIDELRAKYKHASGTAFRCCY
jgi:hypothetical protein